MNTTWTGFLLDPATQTITAVTIPADWKAIAPAIGADRFDVARVDPEDRHSAFVDDEGMYHGAAFTLWRGYPQPLTGKVLVLGHDPETGESCSSTWSAEHIRELVGFGDSLLRIGNRVVLLSDNGRMEIE